MPIHCQENHRQQQQHHERRPLPHIDEREADKRPTRTEEVVRQPDLVEVIRNRTELVVEEEPEHEPDRDWCDEHRREQERSCEVLEPLLALQRECQG